MSRTVHFATPDFSGNERLYLDQCMESGWISSSSEFIHRFEAALTTLFGRSAQVCSSGTAALHLALLALGLTPSTPKREDRDWAVLIPSLAFGAVANAVIYAGGRPVFVDSRKDFQIDPEQAETLVKHLSYRIINAELFGAIGVHTYGASCDAKALRDIVKPYGGVLIEDCAEALDSINGRIGDAACYSFFANKVMTTGEGGAVTGPDISIWRNHGMARAGEYEHDAVGLNYRMSGLQAAIGLAQIERISDLWERHVAAANIYHKKLADFDMVTADDQFSWTYPVRVGEGWVPHVKRDLESMGIETRRVFKPLHLQAPYRPYLIEGQRLPVAERLYREYLCLPTAISEEDAEYVADTLLTVCARYSGRRHSLHCPDPGIHPPAMQQEAAWQ